MSTASVVSGSNRAEVEALGKRLGLNLPPEKLEQAFYHSSYVNEVPEAGLPSNERLEFLGDAVIELAVAERLYFRFPDHQEGELTQVKSAVVSGAALATRARALGLDRCLFLGKGEEAAGGRRRPSLLEDAFEALVGLIFVEQGYSRARDFVVSQLGGEIGRAARGRGRYDFKTRLQELAQKEGHHPVYTLEAEEGADHAKRFTVRVRVADLEGVGRGRSKKEAEQAAAAQVYAKLLHDGPSP